MSFYQKIGYFKLLKPVKSFNSTNCNFGVSDKISSRLSSPTFASIRAFNLNINRNILLGYNFGLLKYSTRVYAHTRLESLKSHKNLSVAFSVVYRLYCTQMPKPSKEKDTNYSPDEEEDEQEWMPPVKSAKMNEMSGLERALSNPHWRQGTAPKEVKMRSTKSDLGSAKRKRRSTHISIEEEDEFISSSPGRKSSSVGVSSPPNHWKEVWDLIEGVRALGGAPVDEVGAEAIGEWKMVEEGTLDATTARYYTLIGLMLSSQTKDQITSAASKRLKQWGEEEAQKYELEHPVPSSHSLESVALTSSIKQPQTTENNSQGKCSYKRTLMESVRLADEATLDKLIYPVAFHSRKATYLKKTAQMLHDKFNDDIPTQYEDIVSLPGVGPKMGYLLMQIALNNVAGIGVDVHVHRISNRLGWAKSNTPEETRKQLQSWLPREYWGKINLLLVGYGQTVCVPIGPKCFTCPVNHLCPSSSIKPNKNKGQNKK